jgi:hypothetical protein|tara:strand:+ start:1180 stop:1449 length:270 start_codon:yes stop_codon:yes gene_type:complete
MSRKPNVFLSDQDIIALQNIIHNGWHVRYVEIGDPNVSIKNMIETGCHVPTIKTPIVDGCSEKESTRLQGILMRLDEGLEHKETIFENS